MTIGTSRDLGIVSTRGFPHRAFGAKLDLLRWVENSPKLLYSYALTPISNRTTGLL